MKNHEWYGVAMLLAVALALFGANHVNWFEPAVESDLQTQHHDTPRQGCVESEDYRNILSGTISTNRQFVDDRGEAVEIAWTDDGLEVRSLIGMQVEVKGYVMGQDGSRTVDVKQYRIVKQEEK